MIVRYGIGVDNVDLGAAAARGIPVCNVPGYCVDEVADHTLGLILTATRGLDVNGRAVREGVWKLAAPLTQMRALRGLTVGIVGLGRIGREVAARLGPFKCRVLAFDPYAPPGRRLGRCRARRPCRAAGGQRRRDAALPVDARDAEAPRPRGVRPDEAGRRARERGAGRRRRHRGSSTPSAPAASPPPAST